MEIKILCPLWGHEHLDITGFLKKIKDAGYDGIDTWVPDDADTKKKLYDGLQQYEMIIVTHQHAASGNSFKDFKQSFYRQLQACAGPSPVLINSHTGRDYFTGEQNLELIDIAAEFSETTGIMVAHETHRGRMGYSPSSIRPYFDLRKNFAITADLSHWVCVSESWLEGFTGVLEEAIQRTVHVHARVGFEEGPQIADPRAPEWQYAVDRFFAWWDRIVAVNKKQQRKTFTFTTEFGPPPYLPTIPFTKEPVADQFEINCYMKQLLHERYRMDPT